MPKTVIEPNIELIAEQYVTQALDTRTIAKIHNISQDTLLRRMHRAGIQLRNAGHKRLEGGFTSYQMEVITGELLGDGCISLYGTYKNGCFQWGGKNHEHGEFLHNTLGEFASYFKTDRTHKGVQYWKLISKAAQVFTPIFNQWYINGRKMVPANLTLTPTVVKHWYYGDGYFKIRVGKNPVIILSTQGFDDHSLQLLINKFNSIGLHPWREKNNKGYVLRFSTSETGKFLTYIGECTLSCYAYKWPS